VTGPLPRIAQGSHAMVPIASFADALTLVLDTIQAELRPLVGDELVVMPLVMRHGNPVSGSAVGGDGESELLVELALLVAVKGRKATDGALETGPWLRCGLALLTVNPRQIEERLRAKAPAGHRDMNGSKHELSILLTGDGRGVRLRLGRVQIEMLAHTEYPEGLAGLTFPAWKLTLAIGLTQEPEPPTRVRSVEIDILSTGSSRLERAVERWELRGCAEDLR
jgi:hypothetical protein